MLLKHWRLLQNRHIIRFHRLTKDWYNLTLALLHNAYQEELKESKQRVNNEQWQAIVSASRAQDGFSQTVEAQCMTKQYDGTDDDDDEEDEDEGMDAFSVLRATKDIDFNDINQAQAQTITQYPACDMDSMLDTLQDQDWDTDDTDDADDTDYTDDEMMQAMVLHRTG